MRETTAAKLKSIAPLIASGAVDRTSPLLNEMTKRAIDIHAIFADGEWHTAVEIGAAIDCAPSYVNDICRECRDVWGLASHRRKGWMIVQKNSAIVV